MSNLDPAPESVPINCLMPMSGMPLADQSPVDIFEVVRLIAAARIALPKASSPGSRAHPAFTRGSGALFFAGANSIFYSEKLLTAKNPTADMDVALFLEPGLQT